MNTLRVRDLDLGHTLGCGQLFRQTCRNGWWEVHAGERLFRIRQSAPDRLQYVGDADEPFLIRFFRLDEDLPAILRSLDKDEHIGAAIRWAHGLRLIRQDAWECLVSFICSQAAHIPKITQTLEALCRTFGRPVCVGDWSSYAFPAPGALDDYEKIVAARTGFRARYLYAASQRMDRARLARISVMPYEAAKQALMDLDGVGHKVADCVLLFGLGFSNAFPVDVWVKRAMEACYFGGSRRSCAEIRRFGQQYFGRYAGYAQQYLYYQWRTHHRRRAGT